MLLFLILVVVRVTKLIIRRNNCGEKVAKSAEIFLNKNKSNWGFKSTANFVHQLTKTSFEKRGFAQSKLIINWKEIVGFDLDKLSKPVKMTFPKNGLGATLTIEINGANGPELELQKENIIEKVNRIYGYTAVTKVNFKASASMGYDSFVKDEFSVKRVEINIKNYKTSVKPEKIDDLIPKLEKVKNQKLRKSLSDLGSNFIKRMK